MPDVRTLFPSKWIKAADLGGKRVLLRMAAVDVEKVGEKKLPVLYFQGTEKGLVLNATNANMIAEITGTTDTDDWRGHQIVLFMAKVDFGGKRVEAIRVDHPPAKAAPTPLAAPRKPAPSVAAPMTPMSALAEAYTEDDAAEGSEDDDSAPF
jgi:hypothetical protein